MSNRIKQDDNSSTSKEKMITEQKSSGTKEAFSIPEESILTKLLTRREIILIICIGIIVIFVPFFNKNFLTFSNLKILLLSNSTVAIMALGIGMLLIMGEIDLSVGANMALSGTLAAIFMQTYGYSVPVSIGVALIATLLVGLVNGLLIVKVGINFLITTLAVQGIIRGTVIILAEGGVAFLPPAFNRIGQNTMLGFQLPVWFMFILVLFFGLMVAKHRFFRQLYFIGGNIKAARLVGISTDKTRMIIYLLSSLLAGLAGILNTARFGSAFPSAGVGAEMSCISAAVLGGCSLSGGQGNMFGVFLGVIFIGLLSNVLVMLNVSTYWHQIINGLVLIAAITFDIVMQRIRKEKQRKMLLQ
ncbi:MAG: ABC transporter permease [Clostridia bacterium]|jgi:ribose transport system permease protein|nr:ABC transporter permease [Clostridia bacterium]